MDLAKGRSSLAFTKWRETPLDHVLPNPARSGPQSLKASLATAIHCLFGNERQNQLLFLRESEIKGSPRFSNAVEVQITGKLFAFTGYSAGPCQMLPPKVVT